MIQTLIIIVILAVVAAITLPPPHTQEIQYQSVTNRKTSSLVSTLQTVYVV